jgi:mono/diheme cytochrome c family protein
MRGRWKKLSGKGLLISALLLLAACRQDMHDQPRYKPLAASTFFADGRASRPRVEGTVARGGLRVETELPVTAESLKRGRERYNIFCSPCHGQLGDGEGMVAQRGFRHPPSFHLERLRRQGDEHYFDVITTGFGGMASYASRIPVEDRWRIVHYIRALQLSQNARINDVPASERGKLTEARP